MKAIAARCLPIPESIDLFFLDQEYPATDTPALDAVFEVDDERKALVLTQRLSSCVDGVVMIVRASARPTQEAEAEKINDAVADCDEDDQEQLNQRLQALYERLDELDAATAEARASAILHGLGFTPKMQRMPTKSFSGGWRMRVALARALFLQPTCLVLDEPTNHLVLTRRQFLRISQLQLCENGVNATSRHRDAVDEAVRASARRVSEPRRCRDGINTGPDHGETSSRGQAHDGGVLHHVQRQARDGEESRRCACGVPSYAVFMNRLHQRRRWVVF